jgi:L-malate glycosyltransferase
VIKVCHIISGDLWAGAEKMAYSLIMELKKLENVKIYVVLFNDGKLAKELIRAKVETGIFAENENSYLTILRRTKRFIKKINPCVVHSHRYKENITAYLLKEANMACLATQHGLPETNIIRLKNFSLISRINDYILANKFSKVVCVSSSMKQSFIAKGFKNERIEVIRNGIEIRECNRIQNRGIFTVGAVGRICKVKDYILFVNIANYILKIEKKPIHFLIAGDGPERNEIQGLIYKFGIEKSCIICGHIDEIKAFYGKLDVFLNTSLHEGIPIAVLEAMEHNVPVVAPNVGGLPEIIHNSIDGYLIDSRDPIEFANKILLLRNWEQRQKMGRSAREKVEKYFSANRMAQEYVRLYSEIINNN